MLYNPMSLKTTVFILNFLHNIGIANRPISFYLFYLIYFILQGRPKVAATVG